MKVQRVQKVQPSLSLSGAQVEGERVGQACTSCTSGTRYVPIERWPEPTRQAIADAPARKATAAAERMREQAQTVPCTCTTGPLPHGDRCERCWGWL